MNFLTNLAIFIALAFGMACAAYAQPPGTHPSYVSIQIRSDAIDSAPTTQSVCGGVVVDEKRKIVATAWHCVPNQRSALANFSMNGARATLVAHSAEADTALFQVKDLKGAKAPTFATPKKGDTVVASAYYDSFPVSALMPDRMMPPMSISTTLDWRGEVAAVANANTRGGPRYDQVEKTPYKYVVVVGMVAPGFSGGPAFTAKGDGFIGLISNVNGGFTNISSSENIQLMLKQLKL